MSRAFSLSYDGHTYELPLVTGTENETAVDISKLRAEAGIITLDSGYANTGACTSSITFIDGERGKLVYRGYPIEVLAEHSNFIETAFLLIFGDLPTTDELAAFRSQLSQHQFIHEDMRHHLEGFPPNAPPMAILSAMINVLGCFEPDIIAADNENFMEHAARLMSKIRTIAAASYRKAIGKPMNYPHSDLRYTANFLHMLFSNPHEPYDTDSVIVDALDRLLILHADHEQNCSTSTVRMVGSAQANLYASVAAGVCALWGPLHGGANVAVIEMLSDLLESGQSLERFVEEVKKKESSVRLMGFGHRVYKNADPRAKIIKEASDRLLDKLGISDPLLDMAIRLEEVALRDPYFIERKLYPNVDYYSGIIMRAIGIPTDMFTVMFAIGRLPGWIAQWREVRTNPQARIDRPRQIYVGATNRTFVPIAERAD
ncbi:MAG: citrate synthase [Gammaproteobacteria bacterium]|nr:citrate synthase [Gammaproteobacteria bacterium]